MTPSFDLSLALAGLDAAGLGLALTARRSGRGGAGEDRGSEVRSMISWARAKGFRAVQIDATVAGVRPRDLDRSGRRDLAATIRRADLKCSGLDLWIPPEHFGDPAHADRAVTAVLGAIDMAAELAGLSSGSIVSTSPSRSGGEGVVSVTLPDKIAVDVQMTIAERARSRSVRIADHAWPVREVAEMMSDVIGIGIDPAAILIGGDDPSVAAARAGARLASARLTDVSRGLTAGGGRVAVGSRAGRLDVLGYFVALTTCGYARPVVVDLRGVADQATSAERVVNELGGG